LQFDYGAQWTVAGDGSEAGLGGMLISGFTTGDTIPLTGFGAISKTFSSGTLVLGDATSDYTTLHIQGTFASSDLQIAHASGASLIFVGPTPPAQTISGVTYTGVTLSNQAASVIGTISVASGIAVYGAGGTYNSWTINNSGTIISNDTYAVAFGSGSSHVGYGIINNESLGVISGGSAGIYMYGPGSVINQYGGTIKATGTSGIHVDGGLGTVVNSGVVLGGNYGVSEYEGGSVINEASGTIAGTVDGVRISGNAGTIVNAGSLYGKVNGVYEYLTGSVTNLASGTISGGVGVVFKSVGSLTNAGVLLGTGNAVSLYEGSTLTNAGTIDAGSTSDYAVLFSPGTVTGASRLIVDPGAVFYGRIADTGGAIELAPTNAGTLYGFGTSITNFGSVVFDPGAHWTVSGRARPAASARSALAASPPVTRST
jgi:fibronectin-binding autotransporter adhesin